MKSSFRSRLNPLVILPLFAGLAHLQAQTAVWNVPSVDSSWNNPANWDVAVVPGPLTNAFIGGATVNYTAPMVAPGIGYLGLTNLATLNIAATGFNVENGTTANSVDVGTWNSGGTLVLTNGGTMLVNGSGSFKISTNGAVMVRPGSKLVVTNSTVTDSLLVGHNARLSSAGFIASLWIEGQVDTSGRITLAGSTSGGTGSRIIVTNGGVLNALGGLRINNTTDDGGQFVLVNGGFANVGDFSITKSLPAAGLILSNGVINATQVRVGVDNSRATASVYGGVLTNTGLFAISDRVNAATSGDRRAFFNIRGGQVYSTTPEGIIIANQGNTATPGTLSNIGGTLDVNAGTLFSEGITLIKDNTLQNAHATFTLSGSGAVYLGGVGLVGNVGANTFYAINLNGGVLGATADYTIAADPTIGAAGTIQASDAANVPHTITLTGVLKGTGTLTKTGAGRLAIQGVGTHTGNILVQEGTLALEGAGSLPTTLKVTVGQNGLFDVGPAYTLNTSQQLVGTGTVSNDVSVATGGIIRPADIASIGTLTLKDDLTLTGGAVLGFDIGSPASRDVLNVNGALNLSGQNDLQVTISGNAPAGVYRLIDYGSFVGDISSLVLSGVGGSLSNNTTDGAIELILTVSRPATNLVWVGDSIANVWDTDATANWKSGATPLTFLAGDSVLFDNTGSTSPAINVSGAVLPSSVTFNASVDYTVSGGGKISGLTSLVKTNTGKVTIETANDYLGATIINGGTVSVAALSDGSVASPLGASSSVSSNLVFNGGTLEYTGVDQTVNRGALLNTDGGTIRVTSSTLVISGTLTGSGKLTKNGDGQLTLTGANDYSGGTLITAGILRANPAGTLGTNVLTLNGTTSPATFQFSGDAQTISNPLVVAGTNNFVQLNGNDTVTGVSGDGTLIVQGTSGNVFTVAGNMSGFTGRVVLDTAGNLRLHPSAGSAAAIFDLGVGTGLLNNRNGGTTNHIGALLGGPSTRVQGGSNDDANNRPTTYMIGGLNTDTLFEGVFSEVTPLRQANIVKVGTGTLTLSGMSSFTGYTIVSNGILKLIDNGSFDSSASIQVAAPGILDVSGRFDGTLNLGMSASQSLTGSGIIRGSVSQGGLGLINPGDSIGTLTVTNVLTLAGPVVMELNRSTVAKNDKLVAGTFSVVGATLTVTNVGPDLVDGDKFQLFDVAVSGLAVQLPTTDSTQTATYVWDDKIAVDGSITLLSGGASPVNPNPTNITVAVSGGNMTLTWPQSHIGWTLQTQTNSLSVGLSNNWVNVSGSAATNRVDLPVSTANGAVFFRLVLPQ